MDLFSGGIPTKEEILVNVNEIFNNGTAREKQAIVDEAVAGRKERAGGLQERGGSETGHEAQYAGERGEGSQERAGGTDTEISKTYKVVTINPAEMPDNEKERRGELLRKAPAIEVERGQITSTPEMSARKAAELWWDENVGEPALYDTEIGEVEINRNSVESSLAHRYGQSKLDAITSLVDGFENAVYLGTMPDFTRQEGVSNHFFAYPIMYDGKRCYVFCRVMQDANKNRLYVHEVFIGDNIKKSDTLQTAASQPHGGITLYKDILANVLETSTQSLRKVNALSSEKQMVGTESSRNEEGSRASGRDSSAVASEVNTSPTEAQKEAGNYKKGHVTIEGMRISIENPRGSVRSGKDADGNSWETEMTMDYGYIWKSHGDLTLSGTRDLTLRAK